MRGEITWYIIAGLAVMGVLGLLRVRFALRFWIQVRRFGYLYVGLIVTLAVLSLILGRRL